MSLNTRSSSSSCNPCQKPCSVCSCSTSTADPTGFFALFTQAVGFLQLPADDPRRRAYFFPLPGQTQSAYQQQVQQVTFQLFRTNLCLRQSCESQALIQNMIQLLNIIGAAGVAGTVIPVINFAPIVQTIEFALCAAQFPFKKRKKVLCELNTRLAAAIAQVQTVPLTPATIQVITNILNILVQIVNNRCL